MRGFWQGFAHAGRGIALGSRGRNFREMLIDLVCPQHDRRFGEVKDVLAGAVLVAAGATAVVGALILGPPLWLVLFG